MPVITVQLGQCGNQLGSSLFQTLATELSANSDYGHGGVDEFFRPLPGKTAQERYVARALLIDMEPKVVQTCMQNAAAAGGWWSYGPCSWLVQQSGAGNNWAQGYHGFGPRVRDAALELVRRESALGSPSVCDVSLTCQVETCDVMGGFVLLQSMAGGTGAGFGTYVAQALRDDYHSSYLLNACVWPYESGEVIVQAYNTLFTLSHLADISDGVVLLQNDVLHRICHKLHNIQRPSFNDMNTVGARSLASILLPSTHRPACSSGGSSEAVNNTGRSPKLPSAGHASPPSHEASDVAERLKAIHLRAPPRHGARASSLSPGAPPAQPPAGVTGSGASVRPVHVLADVVTHLCCHPWYRMLMLRSVPQMPAASVDFTTFTWPSITKRLRQMLITGSAMEEGLDWHVTATPSSSGCSPGTHAPPGRASTNRSLANWLVLRGQAAGGVDVSEFAHPALYPPWSADPLVVSSHSAKFAKCSMSATMLSNDQSCVVPVRRMQERAYQMLSSRAFVHQYEKYHLQLTDFNECLAHIEDLTARYSTL